MRTESNTAGRVSDLNQAEQDCERRLRIAYLTMEDPSDRRSWSGTHYYMAKALEKHCGNVLRVGPLRPTALNLGKAIQRGVRLLSGQRYLYNYTALVSRSLGKMAEERLSREACDVIFAPAGSAILGHLQTRIPIVYLSDTTFKLMINYYNDFSNLIPSHIGLGDRMEGLSIQKSKQLVYPSQWAARSAVEDYKADNLIVNVVPFGANLDDEPSRLQALRCPERDRCRLLFVGVNWDQKGGDIAFETLLELRRLGISAELTIVGCRPPQGLNHPNLRVFGFLNKNDAGERAQLDRLYREATFFILPTRAECFGIVACEASAYGLPVLETNTGGVPEIVREGINGFLFPLDARGDRYADKIRDIYENCDTYQQLRVSTREQFESRLNWDAWGKRMKDILWAAVAPSGESQAKKSVHSSN